MKKRRRSKPNPPKANLPKANSPAEAQSANAELPPPKARRKVVMESFSALFSGPLPTPAMYREYEAILPGIAERIMVMAEKEQAARIENRTEIQSLTIKGRQNSFGQLYAFLIAVLCIGAATFITWQVRTVGAYCIASLLVGTTAVGLVAHFLRKQSRL